MKKLFLAVAFILTGMVSVQGQTRKYYDAVAFDAIDHPEYIITKEGYIVFNKDGSLNKERSTALAGFSKYEIVRDAKGYPIKIVTEFETTTLKYTDLYMIAEKTIKGEENLTIKYVRRANEANEKAVYIYPPIDKSSPYAMFMKSYFMSITEEVFFGTRSKKNTVTYNVSSDRRGNWTEIYTIEKSKPLYHDSRIITYHDYQYDKSAATNVTLDELLSKPFNLEDGHAILCQPLKYVKKNLKDAGFKFKSWADIYELQNYDKTFLGMPLILSYKYHTFLSKDSATSYSVEVEGCNKEESTRMYNLFGFIIKELIEQGVEIKPYFKYRNIGHPEFSAMFRHNGYVVTIPNNIAKFTITYVD